MKKLFTLAAAVLTSFSLWAATEANPTSATKDQAVVGESYTLAGTFVASAGSTKVGDMPDKGVKVRLNKSAGEIANAIEFTVNEGHTINAIQIVGVTNTAGAEATVGAIYVDGAAWNGTFDGTLPAKDAEAASNILVDGIAATSSVVFEFAELNGASQANICWTVTYDGEGGEVIPTPDCTPAEVALAISADKTEGIVEGDVITFAIEGGNGADVVIAGKNGETVAEGKWTAVAGKHTFVASQEDKDGICGGSAQIVLEVASAGGEPEKPALDGNIYAIADMTVDGDKYSWSGAEQKVKNKNLFVEVPSAEAKGEITFIGSSNKADRFLYVYASAGTVKDENRAIVMTVDGAAASFDASDLLASEGKFYLVLATADDFKFSNFSYTLGAGGEVVPPTTYTVTYKANGGAGEDVVAEKATKVEDNSFEAPEGKVFAGWNTAADGTGEAVEVGAKVTSDLVLFAQWEDAPEPGVACAELLPAAEGDALNVGSIVALKEESFGGSIVITGMKKEGESIKYNASGLQLGGGGADSIKVILNNQLAVGSTITLNMLAGGTSKRGLNILANNKKVYEATWTPAENGEPKTIVYTVAEGDGLAGMNEFGLQRNNTVYLVSVVVADCGGDAPTAISNTEAAVKAVKVIRDGQLLIEKNGVLFNAQGAVVR